MRKRKSGRRRGRKKRRPLTQYALAFAFIAFLICVAYISWPKPRVGVTHPTQPTQPSHPSTPQGGRIGGVAIVDMFYSASPKFTDQAVDFLDENGVSVGVHKDSEVTVELYRRLPTYGYALIILRVHAGVLGRDPTAPTFLFTSENYTTGKYMTEQLTDQVMSGVIDPDRPEQPVFTVGPMFVRMSMEGDFRGATIVLSSCLGLYTTHLADALVDRGARAFISWDEKVSLEHTDEATLLLIRALIEEGMTIKQAVGRVMEEAGADPTYGSTLKYYPPEVGGLRVTTIMGTQNLPRHAGAEFAYSVRGPRWPPHRYTSRLGNRQLQDLRSKPHRTNSAR